MHSPTLPSLVCSRQASKAALSSVRVKPSNAHNSSSTEQGEPPSKKLKPDQDDRGIHEAAEPMQPAAVASKPTSEETKRPASAPPQPSLTDMLGEQSMLRFIHFSHVIHLQWLGCAVLWFFSSSSKAKWQKRCPVAASSLQLCIDRYCHSLLCWSCRQLCQRYRRERF